MKIDVADDRNVGCIVDPHRGPWQLRTSAVQRCRCVRERIGDQPGAAIAAQSDHVDAVEVADLLALPMQDRHGELGVGGGEAEHERS